MTQPQPTTTHGDNGGPKVNPEFEAISVRISDLYDEAKNFADGEPIATPEMAEAITTLFDGLHAAGNEAEALRKSEVKPFDDGKAEVQLRFHPLIGDTKAGRGKVVLGKAALQSLLTAFRLSDGECRWIHEDQAKEFMPAAWDDLVIEHILGQRDELRGQLATARAALCFYRDGFGYSVNARYGGLEWKPTEALLDDCGNTARAALGGQP